MSKSIEITCHNCHGLLRLVELPKQDTGACPDCGASIDLKVYLPDYVQGSLRRDNSFFEGFPERTETSTTETVSLPGATSSAHSSPALVSENISNLHESASEVPPPPPNEFSMKLQKLESELKELMNKNRYPAPSSAPSSAPAPSVEAPVAPSSASAPPVAAPVAPSSAPAPPVEAPVAPTSAPAPSIEAPVASVPFSAPAPASHFEVSADINTHPVSSQSFLEEKEAELVKTNASLKEKLNTLDAMHQQLRSEHASLTSRYRNLEDEKKKIIENRNSLNPLISGINSTTKEVTYEKEKNKILKLKWQESLLQLKKSEKQMKELAAKLLEKEGQLKERERFVSAARLQTESQLSELESQGERIRKEAETRKAFEQKILELTKEVNQLRELAKTNEQSRVHLESLLRERDSEVYLQKQSFIETQSKIEAITQEIVEREQALATQLAEIELSREELEQDAKKLEDEKRNLKQLVAELNQRLADVKDAEEKIAKEIKDQELYKNAFANERAELDVLREDVLRQKEEIELSKAQLAEKNKKIVEIQNLLITERQAFEADKLSLLAAQKDKLTQEGELKVSENALHSQKAKLGETEKLLQDREAQLRELASALRKKEEDIEASQQEILLKKEELIKQEERIQSASTKLQEGKDSYDRSVSVYDKDIQSISAEQAKLESVRQRIKEDFVILETQKKEFDEYRRRTEISLEEQKELLRKKEVGLMDGSPAKITHLVSTDEDLSIPFSDSSPSSALQAKKASNKRFSPAKNATEKKRPQYRRFDEAQATQEELTEVRVTNPADISIQNKSQRPSIKDSSQGGVVNVIRDEPALSPQRPSPPQSSRFTETSSNTEAPKNKAQIPPKGAKRPLSPNLQEGKKAPHEVIKELRKKEQQERLTSKSLDEFTPSRKPKNSNTPSKKPKNKVFWSFILIPFLLCGLGVLGYSVLKGKNLSLPDLSSESAELKPQNTDPALLPESKSLSDLKGEEENDLLVKEQLGEEFSFDPEAQKKIDQSLKQNSANLPAVPEDVVSANFQEDTSSPSAPEASLLNEDPSLGENAPSSTLKQDAQPQPPKTKEVVLAKPEKHPPLYDPEDSEKAEHIGMIPDLFLD